MTKSELFATAAATARPNKSPLDSAAANSVAAKTTAKNTAAKREREARPRRHHLDRRADSIAETGDGDDDDLLTTMAVAAWLGVSAEWIEIGRGQRYGPPFVKIGRMVRYRRGDVIDWLRSRTYASTADYGRAR
jgi:hypothetical protein